MKQLIYKNNRNIIKKGGVSNFLISLLFSISTNAILLFKTDTHAKATDFILKYILGTRNEEINILYDFFPNELHLILTTAVVVTMTIVFIPLFFVITKILIKIFSILRYAISNKSKFSKIRDKKRIKGLSWREFEEFCTYLLNKSGYKAVIVGAIGGGGDGGVDILAKKLFNRYVCQCKHQQSVVSVKMIRELFGVMHHKKANGCIFFTTSTFSRFTYEFARKKNILLFDINKLEAIARKVNRY